MAPSSALPIGATRTVSEMQPVKIDPASHASGLLNAVLALLAPPYHDDEAERYDEEVLDLHVVGFLAVYVHSPVSFPLSVADAEALARAQDERGRAKSADDGSLAEPRVVCGPHGGHRLVRVVRAVNREPQKKTQTYKTQLV